MFQQRRYPRPLLYQIRKDEIFITLTYSLQQLFFECHTEHAAFVHTLFYETVADIEYLMKHLQTLTDKDKIGKQLFTAGNGKSAPHAKFSQVISPLAVSTQLHAGTKKEIIEELINLLVTSGQLPMAKKQQVINDVFERESLMSTGLQDGIAFPHAKTDTVKQMLIAVGVKKEGINFDSLDQQPANIFMLTLSPKTAPQPYLHFIAEMTKFLSDKDTRQHILCASDNRQLYEILINAA